MNIGKFPGMALMAVALTVMPLLEAAADERQSLEELRNTVINLLQTLVDQGVITREKAAQLVKTAQDKAAASAAATAKADEGAVRVPYVPQIVKDEIAKQVAETVKPTVVADVVNTARVEKWGVPGALPDWITHIRISGDIGLREEAILFFADNVQNEYLNFYKINQAGGIVKAGESAFLNTDENRFRFRGRARLAFTDDITDSLTAGLRLSTGNSTDLVSPTQTLDGTAPYQFGVDNLFVRYDARTASRFPWLTVIGGRFNSPWFSPTDLIFHRELTFNGTVVTGRLGLGDGSAGQSNAFLTVAAMPVQEIELSAQDKWLYGAQLGTYLHLGNDHKLRFAAAFYDFMNTQGRLNAFDSNTLDYTAPQFLRNGNTLFDIRNDDDPTTNLFALAAKFRLASLSFSYDIPVGRYVLGFAADGVRNMGFKESQVEDRTGTFVAPRTKGYQGYVSFGYPQVVAPGSWRTLIGYRYLQRDAVIDSLTDSDFHGGGTDATGYYFIGDYGLANHLWVRLRYLSANEIDGPRLGVDTVQIDLNTQF